MRVFCTRTARLTVLPASVMLGVACAPAPAPVTTDAVPRTVATLATPNACHVTGAWSLSGESVQPPLVTRCVLPRYPRSMMTAGEQGEIAYRIAVDSAGVPDASSLHVVRTSAPALVKAAEAAAPYLRFASGTSRPAVVVEMTDTFTLKQE